MSLWDECCNQLREGISQMLQEWTVEIQHCLFTIELFLGICLADVLDYLLIFSQPIRRTLRTLANFHIDPEPSHSLMILPDDVLILVLNAVAAVDRRSRCTWYPLPDKARSNVSRLSMANKRMRTLAAPKIFQSVTVGRYWNWPQALRGVSSMACSPDARRFTRSFAIDHYLGGGKGPRPPHRLPAQMACLLPTLGKLKTLNVLLPDHHTQSFRKAFEEASVCLPGVLTLVLGSHAEWLVAHCPNVRTVSTSYSRWSTSNVDGNWRDRHVHDLVRVAGEAGKLQHFTMVAEWRPELLRSVCQELPRLDSLSMDGRPTGTPLRELLPALAGFTALRHLQLSYKPPMPRGWSNTNSETPDDYDRVIGLSPRDARYYYRERKIAEEVVEHCTSLRKLTFHHGTTAKVVRDREGAVDGVHWVCMRPPPPQRHDPNICSLSMSDEGEMREQHPIGEEIAEALGGVYVPEEVGIKVVSRVRHVFVFSR